MALKLPRLAWGAGLAERMARNREVRAMLDRSGTPWRLNISGEIAKNKRGRVLGLQGEVRAIVERRIKAIFIGSIGNLVEWYDFYAYTAFALYFAPAFFPKGDSTSQLLQTAGIFAVGFFMRPLGGWLFGWIADTHGRKNSMVISVLMMCAGSLLIAIMPTYATIGAAAPVVLRKLRRSMQIPPCKTPCATARRRTAGSRAPARGTSSRSASTS